MNLTSLSIASCVRPHLALRLLLIGCALGLLSPAASASQQLYTCGMHPQVIKTEPGDCPICHMKLTPLLGSGGATTGGMSGGAAAQLATITIDPGTIQRMNLKTQEVQREAAEREVRTVGVVAFDERTERTITTRYEGWIEKLFVNTSWQRVKEGEPLFEIYSPALYNAQLNYLVALRSEDGQGGALTAAALDRLRLLGVSDAFIDALKASGKAERNYIYRAPADGVVVEKFARQGQMIAAGEPVYSFASLSPVWVLAQVYERDLPLVKTGQLARVRNSYGQTPVVFEGTVAEILPQVQDATRAAVARIVLDNTDEALLPGMFADVRFVADLGDSVLLVPDEAVLRSGETNRVFVALGEGRFEPREVVLGARTNDHRYVVKEGLDAGETVVVSGQFMLDSESRLREAIAKMVSAATGEAGGTLDAEATAHLAAGHNHGATLAEKRGSGGRNAATHDSANAGGAHALHSAAAGSAQVMDADHSCCSAAELTAPDSADQSAAAIEKREQIRRAPLVVLAFAAADASSALAADDFAAYQKQLPALNKALETYVTEAKIQPGDPLANALQRTAFTAPRDIAQARDAFAPFSNRLTEIIAQGGLHKSGVIHIFECPMVPKVGTGRWLQRENEIVWNPFFGAEMLHCGGTVE